MACSSCRINVEIHYGDTVVITSGLKQAAVGGAELAAACALVLIHAAEPTLRCGLDKPFWICNIEEYGLQDIITKEEYYPSITHNTCLFLT